MQSKKPVLQLVIAVSSIKKDPEGLSEQAMVLKSVRTSARTLVNCWPTVSKKFNLYKEELDKDDDTPTQPSTSASEPRSQIITNNFTKNDRAITNQTFHASLESRVPTTPTTSTTPSSHNRKRKQKDSAELLFAKISADHFHGDNKSLSIDGVDVGSQFKEYQSFITEYVQSKALIIESNTQEILALSNILLIKDDQNSQIFKDHF
ncbi:hypothetical protein K501DRAFT_278318 [Backusella circina FSU 941]|nr:hypothetical protein K501DRAFT_278318 [Backusella circina FSU 941]